ncbi:S-layer homology domain-containing protein [Paenalkalicoccus suaedae]|nr:S-layer homology domain-containing protein [Paenalkalicoccus suaedae]
MQGKSTARLLLVMMVGLLAVLVLGTTVSANGGPTNIPKVTDIELQFNNDLEFFIETSADPTDTDLNFLVNVSQGSFAQPLDKDDITPRLTSDHEDYIDLVGTSHFEDYNYSTSDDNTYYLTIYAYKPYAEDKYISDEPARFIIRTSNGMENDSPFIVTIPNEPADQFFYSQGATSIVKVSKEEINKLEGNTLAIKRNLKYPTLIKPISNLNGVFPYTFNIETNSEETFEFSARVKVDSISDIALSPPDSENRTVRLFKDNGPDYQWQEIIGEAPYKVVNEILDIPSLTGSDKIIAGYEVASVNHTVANGNDHGPDSLRAAIDNAKNGDRITFANDVNTVNLTAPLEINKNVHIDGKGATINGNSIVYDYDYNNNYNWNAPLTVRNGAQIRLENLKLMEFGMDYFHLTDVFTSAPLPNKAIDNNGFLTFSNVVIKAKKSYYWASSLDNNEITISDIYLPSKTVFLNTTVASSFYDTIDLYGHYSETDVEAFNSIFNDYASYNTFDRAENNIFLYGHHVYSLGINDTNTYVATIPFENTGLEPHRTISTFAQARDTGNNIFAPNKRDILNNDRIRNNTIDRGAYELAPISNPTPPAPPVGPTVPADGGADGTPSVQIPINRVANGNGTFSDTVTMTNQQATQLIQRLREADRTTVRIVLPDADDEVANARVNISRAILAQFADADFSLEIATNDGRVIVSNSSLLDFDEDLFFLFRPVKDDEGKLTVENRAKSDDLVTENVGSPDSLFVVGRPMTIETNMQERLVELEFPVPTGDVPTDGTRTLKMFIEHSDGTKELKDVEVFDRDGQTYIRFTTEKFSTFTVLNVELLEDPVTPVEPGFHESYIRGFDDGSFRPSANITRVQVAAMLARNLGFEDAPGTSGFTDVPATHWASGSVGFLKAEGIFGGYSDDTFRPNEPITRGELAAVIARYKGVGGGKSSFTDVSGYWGAGDIAAIQELGIIQGYSDGTFRPRANITRAEAVTMLNRTFERGPLYGVTTPSWPDVPATHWAFEEVEEASRDHSFLPREGGGETIVVE